MQAFAPNGLEQVVHRVGIEGVDGMVAVGRGEDDSRAGPQPGQVLGGLQAVHARHADIEENDIHLLLPGDGQTLEAVLRLQDPRLPAAIAEQIVKAVPRQLLVVNDQYVHLPAAARR